MTVRRGKVFDGGQWYIWAKRISLFLAPEPARGRPGRSRWHAGRFSEFEGDFRRAAAATETVARRFMVPMRGHKTVEATHEPAKALVQPFVAYATKGCPDRLIVIDL